MNGWLAFALMVVWGLAGFSIGWSRRGVKFARLLRRECDHIGRTYPNPFIVLLKIETLERLLAKL